jgi:hypothetical protein
MVNKRKGRPREGGWVADPRRFFSLLVLVSVLSATRVRAQAPTPSDDIPQARAKAVGSSPARETSGRRSRIFGWTRRDPQGRVEDASATPPSTGRLDSRLALVRFQDSPTPPPVPSPNPPPAPDPSEIPPPPPDDVPEAAPPQPSGSPGARDIKTGKEANLGFLPRLFNAYFDPDDLADEGYSSKGRRDSLPDPYNIGKPFPFAEHIGPNVGINDTSIHPLMEALYNGPNGDHWADSGIKIYGWLDPSVNFSTSRKSNIPLSYAIVPNKIELSQAILIFERVPDSVQQDHNDWGFKFTNLYGIDFRYTTAKGYFSNQLLKHNHLYGYDPLQMYVDYYIPRIAEGMIIRMGRYISPIDIEAQLSPENYLYTHSIFYTYDPYTFTGMQFITKLNKNYTLQLGVHAGNDMAPWTRSAQPNGEILLKWVSNSGKDSLFGGVDSIGKGYFSHNHDDLQVLAATWAHRFTERIHTITETYYLWERQALQGGTVTFGTPQPYFMGVGPGNKIPGLASATGFVNYTAFKLGKNDSLVFRNDMLYDPQGFRTGVSTFYSEVTLGLNHYFTDWLLFRPEIRYERSYNAKVYDNNTRKEQYTFSADIIFRF